LGLLYLIAISDKSLHSERDVELALKLPVLALVPTLDIVASRTTPPAGMIEKNYDGVATEA
jgi:hypothetical protein